jgi:hypothetical protein
MGQRQVWVMACVVDGFWRIRCQDGRWRRAPNIHWGDRPSCAKEYSSSGRALRWGSKAPKGAIDVEALRVGWDREGQRHLGGSFHPINLAGGWPSVFTDCQGSVR